VFDPDRLAAVRATGLLDTEAEEPFDRLAGLAATLLDAPLAFITVVDDTRSFWKSCIGVDAEAPASRQNAVEESFCQYVVGSREPLIVGDAANDPITRDNPAIRQMGVAAWAGFPVFAPGGEVLGTFCVVDQRVREWTERDVEVLRTLALAAAGEVALRLALERAGEAAARSESLARTLQRSLLPPRLPAVPHLDVGARHRAGGDGAEVLGDFFDLFETGDRWEVVIGDVCGKGSPAAIVTGLARWTIRTAALGAGRPSDVLHVLNETLLGQPPDEQRHLTAVLASLARDEHGGVRGHLCSAGHVPPLIRRATGAVETVEQFGTLLGAFEGCRLVDVELALAPGDQLVLCTDGVTEARRGRELYGEQRLAAHVAATNADADALAGSITGAVMAWSDAPVHDDVVVLVVGAR
jgi:serine phosphatase RsbU (regulator of sigma subunit)